MSTLDANYQHIVARIEHACRAAKRPLADVKLLAVSKTKPAAQVRACYALGQRCFGENYLQDGLEKITALVDLADIEWHFIGPLQSNKTRAVAEHFHWLETLARDKIAQRLNDQRPDHLPALNVLIQVNISGEPQKAGVMLADIAALAKTVHALPRLTLRGLMCIPENTDDDALLRQQFERMQHAWVELSSQYTSVDTLSMGMSADLELAIACGSTEVRIGTDIFGARSTL